MPPPALKLFFSMTPSEAPPTVQDIPEMMKHLNADPESFILLEYPGGHFQGYEVPDQGHITYHVEYAVIDEENADIQHWENSAPVTMEQFASLLRNLIEGHDSWKELIDWQEMDLSAPIEGEIQIGQFAPKDAHRIIDAMDQNEIPVRMEQVTGTSFAIIISGADLERANDVLAKAMNLQV
ncbi:hypothetical protein P0Y35_16205 [Kiritimatiellaeota bacterium B1221]|nr:hypothetical protein [Kiritimatiellaeota bacterium B1221]